LKGQPDEQAEKITSLVAFDKQALSRLEHFHQWCSDAAGRVLVPFGFVLAHL
jgi:hypothetical protein